MGQAGDAGEQVLCVGCACNMGRPVWGSQLIIQRWMREAGSLKSFSYNEAAHRAREWGTRALQGR